MQTSARERKRNSTETGRKGGSQFPMISNHRGSPLGDSIHRGLSMCGGDIGYHTGIDNSQPLRSLEFQFCIDDASIPCHRCRSDDMPIWIRHQAQPLELNSSSERTSGSGPLKPVMYGLPIAGVEVNAEALKNRMVSRMASRIAAMSNGCV